MLYKYHPPVINFPSPQSMPQLDFRAALSTPEEKRLSPPRSPNVGPVSMSAAAKSSAKDFLRGVGFSRSTWANIVFVGIASVGGLVCAFYFFNGGELLRAAASWPGEYLYARPLSTDKLDNSQPNPIDHFSQNNSSSDASMATSKTRDAQQSVNQPLFASNGTPPTITTEPTNPGTGLIPPDPVIIIPPTVLPIPPSLLDDLNTFVSGVDGQIQSLFQGATSTVSTAVATTTTTVKQTTKKTISSARKKSSSTQQKVTTTAASANSTARNLQQTTSQTQVTQMSMNAVRPVNQMMSGGGMGGGMGGIGGGGLSAGASSAGAGGGAGGGGLG